VSSSFASELASTDKLKGDPLRYTHAIVRNIDPSLVTHALRHDTSVSVNLDIANKQHDMLVQALLDLNIHVTTLESGGYADGVFVEDTCVIIGDVIFMTVPGHYSRRKEGEAIHHALQQHVTKCNNNNNNNNNKNKETKSQKRIVVMADENGQGTIDGGDVLFTGGGEVFIGLTKRTNQQGIDAFAKAFSHLVVHSVDMSSIKASSSAANPTPPLHLKSVCTLAGQQHLLVGGPYGLSVRRIIERLSPSR